MKLPRVSLLIAGLLVGITVIVVLPIELWVRSTRFAELAAYYAQRVEAMGRVGRMPDNSVKGKARMAVVQNAIIIPAGPDADLLEQQYYRFLEMRDTFGTLARCPWLPVPLPPPP